MYKNKILGLFIAAVLFVVSLMPVVATADERQPVKISGENAAEIRNALTNALLGRWQNASFLSRVNDRYCRCYAFRAWRKYPGLFLAFAI